MKRTILAFLASVVSTLSLPFTAFAQTGIDTNKITPYTKGISTLINEALVPALIAIAFFTFIIGVYKYFIYGADDEGARTTGKQFIMWGIVGFVVIFAFWGLVTLVGSTFGLSLGGKAITPPTL
ncbi:MAG: hypothetical protein WAW90_01545 [Minisyncoccia bacterium]